MAQHYEEGKPVKKGQVMFTLDDRSYKADLKFALAALDKAKADLQVAKAQLSLAELNEKRLKPLAEQKAVPQQDYDNAFTDLKVKKSSIALAEAEIEKAQAQVANAKVNLSYCTVVSPIDGIAGERLYSPGNLVGQGQGTKLTTVTALDPLRVDFSISENDYLKIAKKYFTEKKRPTTVPVLDIILADGSKYSYRGKIILAEPVIDPKTGTLTIVAEFPNPDYFLRPGMFSRIGLIVDYLKDALLVPQKAVMVLQSAKNVYVLDKDNMVALKTIELGAIIDEMVVVKNGLTENDQVIIEGQVKVHPGMKANPTYVPATKNTGEK